MRHLLILPAALLLCLAFSRCIVWAPNPDHVDNYNLRVEYRQDACFGRCPVYTLRLYDNGLLIYNGERFTEKPGTWYQLLGRSETVAIIDSLAALPGHTFPSVMPSQIPDLSKRTLRFKPDRGESWEVAFKEQAPAGLMPIADRLNELAESNNYKKYEKDMSIFGPENDLSPQELIVELRIGVDPQAWVLNYSKQNVQLKERLSPSSSYYLITADPNIMEADELLGFLRQDEDVISAQRNMQVKPR